MVHTPTYTRVVQPSEVEYVEAHYRTTHMPEESYKAKVLFATGTRAQLAHTHYVTDLTRFGDGICHSCGLLLWSPSWVAAGVFGEATGEWIAARIRVEADLCNRDHLALSVPMVLAAMLDEDPAMVDTQEHTPIRA